MTKLLCCPILVALGDQLLNTSLGNVHLICTLLKKYHRPDIDVVGVGGIQSGKDVFQMILSAAVQVDTAHLSEANPISRILEEFKTLLAQKHYTTIAQFIKSPNSPKEFAWPINYA